MTNADLNEKGLRINFLDYENLKFKIKELMQNIEKNTPIIGPHLLRISFEVGITQKGCCAIYKKLMSCDYKIIQNVKQKWEEVLNDDITYSTLETAFKDISKMKESAYYKYLHFKMLHTVL